MDMQFCRDVAAAIDFCKNTFGAVERVRRPAVAGGAKVQIPVENQFWGDRIGWVMAERDSARDSLE